MEQPKVIALLQARSDSTRLPQKVLAPILDMPMVVCQLRRVARSRLIDMLILVTSDAPSDDALATVVAQYHFPVFRGDKDDVLKRFFDATQPLELSDNDIIVRLTGDCPLHDARLIDECIDVFIAQDCDYISNVAPPTYPDGFDVEVFSYRALLHAHAMARLPSEREHVTPYMRTDKFVVGAFEHTPAHPEWRLTVDEASDLELVQQIYAHFNHVIFSFEDIVLFLESHPELLNINQHINRNAGYAKSLQADKEHSHDL